MSSPRCCSRGSSSTTTSPASSASSTPIWIKTPHRMKQQERNCLFVLATRPHTPLITSKQYDRSTLLLPGFRKIDPDRWEFANEGFLRGQRQLLRLIKRRRPPSYLPGPQQQALGSCLEVGQFGGGLDEEMDRLRRDKNILLAEVGKLRQEQQSTRADMRAMEERLQHAEQKQVQMMGFLARALQNPDFFQQLAQQQERRRELEDAFSSRKRRRPPIDAAPFEEASGRPRDDEPPLLFRGCGGFEAGTSELENLALNIQGLGKRRQDEKQAPGGGGGETAELTDEFWEELTDEFC
ncbi:heat stress transcription factor A-2d-like isoform X2 [Panicum virgatum]|uniref:heat stress transcription factor A-2d-like isoform X2 n=1 Tax=Panicum virgatum TaxID=38727 RepID=UPI0019D621D1|nr:heat stress transcription factor A-2d-like isoform X2 [Panicum virgatum]